MRRTLAIAIVCLLLLVLIPDQVAAQDNVAVFGDARGARYAVSVLGGAICYMPPCIAVSALGPAVGTVAISGTEAYGRHDCFDTRDQVLVCQDGVAFGGLGPAHGTVAASTGSAASPEVCIWITPVPSMLDEEETVCRSGAAVSVFSTPHGSVVVSIWDASNGQGAQADRTCQDLDDQVEVCDHGLAATGMGPARGTAAASVGGDAQGERGCVSAQALADKAICTDGVAISLFGQADGGIAVSGCQLTETCL